MCEARTTCSHSRQSRIDESGEWPLFILLAGVQASKSFPGIICDSFPGWRQMIERLTMIRRLTLSSIK